MALPSLSHQPSPSDSNILQISRDYYKKYYWDPHRWVREKLGVTLWSKQVEILESVFFNRKTSVRSCHGAGKTFVAACAVLAFMFLRTPCKVITSAPTYVQVIDLLWSEIRQLYESKLREIHKYPWPIAKSKLEVGANWFARGVSPKDSVNFQGFHAPHVLVVLDESPGVRTDVVQGAETLESSGDVHVLQIGNPIASSGHFYESFRDPAYNNIHISYKHTPNFTGEGVPASVADSLISKEWVDERRGKWGEGSTLWQCKVEGAFPEEGEDQINSLAACDRAQARWYELPEENPVDDIVGVDVAWYGGDLSVITRRNGLRIVDIASLSNRDPIEVGGRVEMMYRHKPFRVANVDRIGFGAGTLAYLQHAGVPAVAVDASERAYNNEDYFNRRCELWFDGANWLKTGGLPPDKLVPSVEDLMLELTEPKYMIRQGKYWVEPKEEIRKPKRLGHSPDYADSFNMAVTRERRREHPVMSDNVSIDDMMAKMGLSSSGNSLGLGTVDSTIVTTSRNGTVRTSSEDIIRGVIGGG